MEKVDEDVPQPSRRAVLTKTDLIRMVSAASGITLKEAEAVMETILGAMVRTLRAGERVEIRSFGSFHTRRRLPRVGRNPKTGARVEVPAKNIAYFTPAKELKAGLAELAVS